MNETETLSPSLRDIEAAACARFGLTVEQLRGPKKVRGIVRPRQIVMYLAREMTPLSYPRIGAHFNRDHTTVLSGERRIRALIEEKPKVAAYVSEVRAMIRPREKLLARELSLLPLVTTHSDTQPRLPLLRASAPEGEVAEATPLSAGASRAQRQSCEGRRG
jgi:hypothetical protein